MLSNEKSALTAIIKDNFFFKNVIEKVTLDQELNNKEKSFILSCALIFLNEYNKNRSFKSYADISYYIILKYSIRYKDYRPLYDFSTVFGFYPITNSILKNKLLENNCFNDLVIKIKLGEFKNVSDNSTYIETLEQNNKKNSFINDDSFEKGFIAPTSFGKSNVIIDFIKTLDFSNKIAIIVPTKSLLIQTYKMIRDAKLDYRILIHDEMYLDEDHFIGVFTQERALRLLKNKKVFYDVLIIDEAHNILDNDNRSILISRLLRVNKAKNDNQKVIYLSPLINDIENIKIHDKQIIKSHTINFNIKSPEIYEYKIDKTLVKHNRFFINDNNKGFEIEKYDTHFSVLKKHSGKKNFLYCYRPVDIEHLAKELAKNTSILKENFEIIKIMEVLKKEVHEKFYCINLLKHGVIYLHGKLPDLIKEYLEKKFKDIYDIQFVIANSVILEGINLPIDKLFIFNTRSLQGKELTNLIGRVNRLNEIFKDGNNLQKLLPSIYFINNLEYNHRKSNGETISVDMFNKIKELRNRSFTDDVANPLLQKFNIESIKNSDKEQQEKARLKVQQLIRYEDSLMLDLEDPKEKLKQYLIENGFNLFYNDINKLASELFNKTKSSIVKTKEWQEKNLLDKIYDLFLEDFIYLDNFIIDFEFYRLKEIKARKYYEMHIENRNKSLKENVNHLFNHLKKRKESLNEIDHIYYIGSSYGEVKYTSGKYFNELKNFNVAINLKNKKDEELINYAIVKLKIEDDFISFKLNKFIVFLYDYGFISSDEYHTYIYGTTDKKKIALSKFGLNIGLIDRLQKDNQIDNLVLDKNNNLTSNSDFRIYLESLNDFQKFEIERFIL